MPRAPPQVIPSVDASFLSQLTYLWLTPLMNVGYQRTIQASDLWKVHETQEAGRLSQQLDDAWNRRLLMATEWNAGLDSGSIKPGRLRDILWSIKALMSSGSYHENYASLESNWREVGGRKSPSLVWALNDVFGHMFWISGAFKVVGDTSQLIVPVLVKIIINFAKSRATAREDGTPLPGLGPGIGMAVGMLCLVILSSVTQHQFFYRSMTTGVLARAALTNSIYKRGVVLSGKDRVHFTNANLMTFISTDCSRIDAAAQWFHAGWTSPLQVIICLIILLVHLGPSALVGFALFLLVAPIQQRVMAHRLRIGKIAVKFTEKRAKLLAEALDAIRIVKYFSYEEPFLTRLNNTRSNEINGVRQMNHMHSANAAFAYSIPVLAATLAFVTYNNTTQNFDPAIIFASFSLFQLLRQPMMFFPRAMSVTTDARNALNRLEKFFHAEVMSAVPFLVDENQKLALQVSNASFEWEQPLAPTDVKKKADGGSSSSDRSGTATPEKPFKVQRIDLSIPRGTLVAIVGRVGSGKSSVLQGLLGEMRKLSGDITFGGRVAYCAQTAWIQNATLRENVLFGQPFDEQRYWRVLEMSCLIPDLQVLPAADMTEIGERGINLSGGQKQRVNIARALYQNADVLLLDDPLSAVDAHVGKSLFHNAILPLVEADKTVVLVTHARHFLSYCDHIYTMSDGRIEEHGSYQDLMSRAGAFARLDKEFGGKEQQEEDDQKVQTVAPIVLEQVKMKSQKSASGSGKLDGKLIRNESRRTGSVGWKVYRTYLKAGKAYTTMPFIVLSALLMQGSQIVSTYSLVWWQAKSVVSPLELSLLFKNLISSTFNRPMWFYQVLYAGLGLAQATGTFALGFGADFLSTYVSKNLHRDSVTHILYAQMSFFDTTPKGRIQSVFGKDIDNIDNSLPTSLKMFAITMANVVGAVVIITVLEWYIIIAAVFIAIFYNYFAGFYRASSREVKRLDAVLRSLLYAHFSESLNGLPTIRSYREVPRFVRDNMKYIDLQDRALLLTVANQRWLAVRLDALGAILVFCVATLAVVGVSGISPAQVGLVLSYCSTITQLCAIVTRQSAEVENYMNSVERVTQYSNGEHIEQEAPHHIPETQPAPDWPSKGAIELKDVGLRYRPDLPRVLQDVTASIKGGEKIGIVGRTGAGKSSLVLSLLRMVEFEGQITIDGVDISKIGLRDLRTKLAIIPQDPTLFSGTVRTTLDPFSQYDDARLWDALRRSFLVENSVEPSPSSSITDLSEKPNNTKITLDSIIDVDGANLSVGERSLMSLARALVRETRVVILDEATFVAKFYALCAADELLFSASVDLETDRKIQETIHSQFKDRTLLCIAHRLRTIIAYDRILVMDAGSVAEFDTPLALFKQETSIFRSLCEKSGITLRDIEMGA
ncbi:hypothetical protein V5O48_008389 [Marasmius crinis-equi]|uniref:P-loop containing nucleoside triphosphate hydrolase protein n=1 Tax=Marasmius crinis-equi TaxID=585013 RepID=A0ABR3FEA6_9AGAR